MHWKYQNCIKNIIVNIFNNIILNIIDRVPEFITKYFNTDIFHNIYFLIVVLNCSIFFQVKRIRGSDVCISKKESFFYLKKTIKK